MYTVLKKNPKDSRADYCMEVLSFRTEIEAARYIDKRDGRFPIIMELDAPSLLLCDRKQFVCDLLHYVREHQEKYHGEMPTAIRLTFETQSEWEMCNDWFRSYWPESGSLQIQCNRLFGAGFVGVYLKYKEASK
jgi:hypothetical protein